MPIKLLVADDSVTIQKVVGLAFAGEDVSIEAVGNGDAALQSARRIKPDIVLADIFMPGMNGYEVCKNIKEDAELGHIPVILLVGTFEPFDTDAAARVRSNASLRKPFDVSELTDLVHKLTGTGRPSPTVRQTQAGVIQVLLTRIAASARQPVGPRTRESFIGSGRILEILVADQPNSIARAVRSESWGEPDSLLAARRLPELQEDVALPKPVIGEARPAAPLSSLQETAASQVIPFPSAKQEAGLPAGPLSEEWANVIVEKLVRRISQDVIREVAWEVVPELAEALIRQRLHERKDEG